MKAKRFGHFLAFWRQYLRQQNRKAPARRRVATAKSSLRTVLAA